MPLRGPLLPAGQRLPGELRVDPTGVVGGGPHLSPGAVHKLVQERGDDVVFFDGRNAFEAELRNRNIVQKNGSPSHPQTQGKVERFQQTMKNWLRAHDPQPRSLEELQQLLDQFAEEYNERRPHRALPHHSTPAARYFALPKATPTSTTDTRFYLSWWNASTMEQFWRWWNRPVHTWCVRHVYLPVVTCGWGKMSAMMATFLFSAALHEYLISGESD